MVVTVILTKGRGDGCRVVNCLPQSLLASENSHIIFLYLKVYLESHKFIRILHVLRHELGVDMSVLEQVPQIERSLVHSLLGIGIQVDFDKHEVIHQYVRKAFESFLNVDKLSEVQNQSVFLSGGISVHNCG